MTQETFIIFISIAAIFFAGAAVGQLLLRLQLARLQHINLKMDRRLLASLARAHAPVSLETAGEIHYARNEDEIRDEINALVSEIERS